MKRYTLPINGIDYACIEAGEGPLVLLSHGTFGGKDLMLPQMEALQPSFRCVAFDWPGHGESGYRPGGWTARDLVNDQVALIDALGADKAILAGTSQGGAIAMRTAIAYPEHVIAIVNMCGGPSGPPPAAIAKLDAFAALMATETNEAARRAAATDFARSYLHAPGFAERQPETFATEIDVLLKHPRESVSLLFCVPKSYDDITLALGDIRVPTLIIWGESEARANLGSELAAAIPGAKLVTIRHAGHHVNVEEPAATSEALLRFLNPWTQ